MVYLEAEYLIDLSYCSLYFVCATFLWYNICCRILSACSTVDSVKLDNRFGSVSTGSWFPNITSAIEHAGRPKWASKGVTPILEWYDVLYAFTAMGRYMSQSSPASLMNFARAGFTTLFTRSVLPFPAGWNGDERILCVQAAWPSAGRGRLRSFWLGLTRSSLPFHVCKLLRSLERLLKLGRRTILSLRPIQTCHMRLFR